MAKHHRFEVALDGLQFAAVVVGHVGRRNAGDLGHDVFDFRLANRLFAFGRHLNALGGTGLVDHVNGFVRQLAVVDELGRQLSRRLQSGDGVLDAVVVFKAALEAFEDVHRLGHGGLNHVHFLEAAAQGRVFFENPAVFGEGGRTNALELATGQGWLEQVRCVQGAARGCTRTNQGVDFVDEQNAVGLVLERLEHTFEALLKITPVLGARQQCAHVEGIHRGFGQDVGHGALGDTPGQALGNRGLAHTGLTHQQRVIFAAAAQDLDGALDFVLTANQRIDLAFFGGLVQVVGELLQRRGLFVAFTPIGLFGFGAGRRVGFGSFRWIALADAVGDEVHHIQTRDALLVQVVDSVRVFFAKDGDQHIGAGHFLFAIAGGLHMHDGALDHTLETQGGLGVHLFGTGHLGRVVLDEVAQGLAQIVYVGGASAEHFCGAGVVQQGQQQMLDGDEFVALLTGFNKGHVQADFQFLGNHVISLCLAE